MEKIITMKKIVKISVCLLYITALCISFGGCAVKCEKCEGTGSVACTICNNGKIECTSCNGTKHSACTECEGKGTVLTDERCSSCKDSKRPGYRYDTAQAIKDIYYGRMTNANDSKYWSECYACDGTGYQSEECPACEGSGLGELCDTCGGTGEITCTHCNGSLLVTCPDCSGEGKIKK